MELKIWQENGTRHTSLDGVEIGNMIMGLDLSNHPYRPSQVYLQMVATEVEVKVEAEVYVNIGGKQYRIKE